MKKIILAVTLLTLAVGFSTAQEGGTVKKVQVTKQTLEGRTAGEPYRIDLTRKGTVYELAGGVNLSLVLVSTSTGETPLKELIRKSGRTVTGNLLVGTIDDLSAGDFGFFRLPPGGGTVLPPGGGVMEVKCDQGTCDCVAGRDCRDLQKSGLCVTTPDDYIYCCQTCGTGNKRGCFCVAKKVP